MPRSENDELLGEQVYQSVKVDILRGLLSPGAVLSIARLAEGHNVSRTPVRQALDALTREGFVEAIPRVGYFVSTLTVQDIRDMFGLRKILECAAAELAAPRISEADLARLEELNTTFVHGDINSYMSYLQNNRDFHCTIAAAAGNKWLVEAIGDLLEHSQRLFVIRLNAGVQVSEELSTEHREMIEALRTGDGNLARQVVGQWIKKAEDDILTAIVRGRAHLKLSV
jgi:DNA-binding GntR family transcriptional regulator